MTTMQRRFAAWARGLVMLTAAAFTIAGGAWAQADADPPGRVARLAELNGQVWVYSPDAGEWVAASRNQPLTSGDRVATESGARAELQIGSTSVRLDANSELEVSRLDDEHVGLELHDGGVIARVRDLTGAGQLDLTTEEGRFVALRAGTYRVDRNNGRSDLTVYSGQARYEGPNSGLPVEAGQRAEFWIDSGGVAQYSMLSPVNDAFVAWSNDRDRRFVGAIAERYVSPEMTGAAELDAYGRWEQTPDYGSVWIPTAVAADWAPYSQGRWAWVRPWGWTWVDDAPWGFAPFHYGRWVYFRNNWCWTPGTRVARPVYAPALVAWVGGPRANVSITVGGGPAVGWLPLGPREVYVPSYRVSPRYARNVNITNVTNVTVINNVFANPQGPREFENRRFPRAITVVPANVMAERRPVGPAAAQYRQAPWARDFANQPGRTTALLAPPVAAPAMPARGSDPRAVRPPPGARPDAGDRPGFAGRPGSPPRDRSENDRDRRPAPQEPTPAQQGRAPERGFGPGQRPPGIAAQQPGGTQMPATPPAVQPTVPPPNVSRPPGAFEQRDPRRAEEREREPGRLPRERDGNPNFSRERDGNPNFTRERDGNPGFARDGNPNVARPPIGQPIPAQQAPTQLPAIPAPRPALTPPAPQEAPTMRALPVQRGEERRFDERRQEERRLSPRFEAPMPQAPAEARQPPAPRVERSAPAMQPAAPAPVMRPAEPPRAAEPPRPAAPAMAPAAPPQAPRMEPPQQQRPRGPEQRGEGPRRGDRDN